MVSFSASTEFLNRFVQILRNAPSMGPRGWMLALALGVPALGFAEPNLRVQGDSNPVRVYVSVTTTNGAPLNALAPSAFQLTEDGASQPVVLTQEPGTRPVALVFAMDYSGSMRDSNALVPMEQAVARLLAKLGSADQAAIVKFKGDVFIAQDLTADRQALAAGVRQDFTGGQGTHLYDGIDTAVNIVKDAALRGFSPAVVVLSDGDDSGSTLMLDQLAKNVDDANVPLFTIGFGNAAGLDVLMQLAAASGGLPAATTDPAQLDGIYDNVGARLQTEYLLEYQSALSDCGSHALEVIVDTAEGVKRYSGSLQRCFPSLDAAVAAGSAQPSSAGSGSGGGGLFAWIECCVLMLAIFPKRRWQ